MPPLKPSVGRQYKKIYSKQNLDLAWDRLSTSREPSYKQLWRASLSVAEKSKKSFLRRIANDIKSFKFNPNHAQIISEPKKSTLLRHKSLLSLGDLVTYQAIVNIIADQAYPKLSRLYGSSTYGNRYSGPRSIFFYQDWLQSYREFTLANINAFDNGYDWLLSFDLASFYDSINHSSLEAILIRDFGIESNVVNLLIELLKTWSNAVMVERPKQTTPIFLGSGIPQGPLPSSLLAEVMLSYIDEIMLKQKDIVYLRYADDIRIWSKSELSVRKAAAYLDRACRNIGVFPQTGKFHLEKISDINEVIKSVSLPDTFSRSNSDWSPVLPKDWLKNKTHRQMIRLIESAINSGNVDETKLKYYLNRSQPVEAAVEFVIDLMEAYPHLTEPCCYFIERLDNIGKHTYTRLLALAHKQPWYPYLAGRIFRVLWKFRHNSTGNKAALRKILRSMPNRGIQTDCILQGIVMVFRWYLDDVKPRELSKWIKNPETTWWAKSFFCLNADSGAYHSTALLGFLVQLVDDSHAEVSRSAAFRLALLGQKISTNNIVYKNEADEIFSSFGLSNQRSKAGSRINLIIERLLTENQISGVNRFRINWTSLLANQHGDVERYAVLILGEHRSNRNLFIQYLDAMCELICYQIWAPRGFCQLMLAHREISERVMERWCERKFYVRQLK